MNCSYEGVETALMTGKKQANLQEAAVMNEEVKVQLQ